MARQPVSRFRLSTAILGSALLLGALIAGWFVLFHRQGGVFISFLPGAGADATAPAQQSGPLLSSGITLTSTDQQPALSQQQALAIARQFEPGAAATASNVSARYVLLTSTSLKNVPTWMIWYQKIPATSTLTNIDPTPPAQTTHDLYLFLDATTGEELLSIWI